MSTREILAINLKYYRYKLNLSQGKFAEKLVRRKSSLELIDKFADKLGVSAAKLLTYNPKHIIKQRINSKK